MINKEDGRNTFDALIFRGTVSCIRGRVKLRGCFLSFSAAIFLIPSPPPPELWVVGVDWSFSQLSYQGDTQTRR